MARVSKNSKEFIYRRLKQVGEYQELVCDPNQSAKMLFSTDSFQALG